MYIIPLPMLFWITISFFILKITYFILKAYKNPPHPFLDKFSSIIKFSPIKFKIAFIKKDA